MQLNRNKLRRMILSELSKVKSAENQQSLNKLCEQIQTAENTAGILFESDGDQLFQTIEMILQNLKKICEAKKEGKTLSGDPKRALLKHVNAIKQDVD